MMILGLVTVKASLHLWVTNLIVQLKEASGSSSNLAFVAFKGSSCSGCPLVAITAEDLAYVVQQFLGLIAVHGAVVAKPVVVVGDATKNKTTRIWFFNVEKTSASELISEFIA